MLFRCKKRRIRSKKGTVAIYISLMISAMVIVLIAAVFAPLGVEFNTQMYLAGQDILSQANASIQSINDATIRTQVQGSVDNAFAAAGNNIEVNANLFQYGWILIIGLTALVVFLYTRRMVEYSGGWV